MKLAYHFSKFVKEKRQEKKWDKAKLGLLAGVTRATIWNIEKRSLNVTLHTVESVLKALDCTLQDFYDYIEGNK